MWYLIGELRTENRPLKGDSMALTDELRGRIQDTIDSNEVVLYMKGNAMFPRCGFSAAVVDIFERMGVQYGAMDILPDPRLRQMLSSHSNWPTIPQVYVGGEFLGGSDILMQMHENGELAEMIESATKA